MMRCSPRLLSWVAGVWMLAGLGCKPGPPPEELPVVRYDTPPVVEAAPGELVTLGVSGEDPGGGALTFEWSANTGSLGEPEQSGNASQVRWTAVSCVPAGMRPMMEVAATGASGETVRLRFEVTWSGPVCGPPPCELTLEPELLTLRGDCTTDTPVLIPEGYTLEGSGRSVAAVDPAGGSFPGAIVRNRGTVAHVRNLKVRAQGLLKDGPCDQGEARLRGILLQGASGSVTGTEVVDVHRNQRAAGIPEGTPRGCQEGIAIEVRNPDATVERTVELRGNQVRGYQKAGLVVAGQVKATVVENTLTGAGPVGYISQNGIQLSDGATGEVSRNQLSGHSYSGSSDVATGILVVGGPFFGTARVRDALIQGNTLTGNDIGIYLDQAEADGSGSAEPTRLQVVRNTLRNEAVTNGYPYRAGISDVGGGNLIHSNAISGAGYDPATQPGVTFAVDVVAGPVTRVGFLTAARTVASGVCSGEVVVQSQDSQGNLSRATPTVFGLTASGSAAAGLRFYADSSCAGLELSAVDLSSFEAARTFFFKAAQAGKVTLTVSNGSVSGTQEQTATGP